MSIFFLIVLVFGDRYAIQIDEANSLLLCYYYCEMQTVKAKEAVLVHMMRCFYFCSCRRLFLVASDP